MTRRDLRTAERDWRNTRHSAPTHAARRIRREPLTLGRMLNALLRWL